MMMKEYHFSDKMSITCDDIAGTGGTSGLRPHIIVQIFSLSLHAYSHTSLYLHGG